MVASNPLEDLLTSTILKSVDFSNNINEVVKSVTYLMKLNSASFCSIDNHVRSRF